MHDSINDFVNLLINNFDDTIFILDIDLNITFYNNKFNLNEEEINFIKGNLNTNEFTLNSNYKCHIQKTNINEMSYIVYIHNINKKFESIQLNDLFKIITDTPLGLIVYDVKNNEFELKYTNDKALSIIEKDKSDINNIKDLLDIDLIDIDNFYISKEIHPINKAIETKKSIINKIVYIYKNNKKNCYSINVVPNLTDDDEIRNIIISFKEMNDIMVLKRDAKLNEYYYKNLLEKSPNGIVIIQDFNLIYYNKSMMKMLSCDDNDLINKSILNFMDENNKSEFKYWHSIRSKNNNNSDIEFKLTDKNGKIIYCLGSFSSIEINNKPASLCFIKDITQLKNQEKKLKQYHDQLETLVEKRTKELETTKKEYELIANESPIGIIKINCNGDIRFSNKKIENVIGNIENICDSIPIFHCDYFYNMYINDEFEDEIEIKDLMNKKKFFKLKIKKINVNEILIMFVDETKEKFLIPELMQLKREMFQNSNGQLNIDVN